MLIAEATPTGVLTTVDWTGIYYLFNTYQRRDRMWTGYTRNIRAGEPGLWHLMRVWHGSRAWRNELQGSVHVFSGFSGPHGLFLNCPNLSLVVSGFMKQCNSQPGSYFHSHENNVCSFLGVFIYLNFKLHLLSAWVSSRGMSICTSPYIFLLLSFAFVACLQFVNHSWRE